MKKSRIIIIGFLILLVVVLIFAMPTLGKLLKINANDVQKIEISQDIYYLDDDYEALWTTVTDSNDISKLVKALNRPFIRKGYEPTAGGSRRKVVFHLTHGVKVELYLLQDRGVYLNGELYGFLFSFGRHRKVVYDDIDRILEQYEFSKGIPDEPVPPSDEVLAEYLIPQTSACRIDEEMYISQAYLITDAETDSYSSYLYFLFDNDEIRAVLNLSLSPDSEGHYANGTYLVNGEEVLTACFKRIIDEKLSFGLISTGGAYPLLVLCADDGCETIIDPVNERGNIDIEDTDEVFSLRCFERKNLELRKVGDIMKNVFDVLG